MSGLLGSIGTFLGNNVGWLAPTAVAGGGLLANYLQQKQYQDQLNRYNAEQQFAFNLAKNPQAAEQYVAGYTRPISAGLTADITNEVQANLGERGLTLSGPIWAATLAQALAPAYQQEQQLGATTAENMLRLGTGMAQPEQPHPYNISGSLAALMDRYGARGPGTSGGGSDPTQDPFGGPPFNPADVISLDPSGAPIWNGYPIGGGGESPDWTSIMGGFTPSIPSFDMPVMGGGIGIS